MDRRTSRLVVGAAFGLMLMGAIWSMANASVFVAWVRDPQDVYSDEYCNFVLNELPRIGDANNADDAWSLTWYGAQNPLTILGSQRRKGHDECEVETLDTLYYVDGSETPTDCYTTISDQAATNASRVILGHGRRNNQNNNQPNPHPFIYDDIPYQNQGLPPDFHLRGIFGKSYSFVHNGTVNVISPGGMEDKVGPGFIALDIFHDRPYGGRIMDGIYVDSEFLAMLIMKHLLAQENYYWYGTEGVPGNDRPVGITSREDWAICRTAQNINVPGANTSINGVFTDGKTLWAIMKSDEFSPHFVFYGDNWSDPLVRARGVVSMLNPSDPDYDFVQLAQNNILILSGGADGGPHPGPEPEQNPHSLDIAGDYPRELRVKPEKDLDRDAVQPAISVSQADGSFVAVWVTSAGMQANEAITARWYNQMGMAEDYGFTVHSGATSQGLNSPAIAHSGDGQTIVVVWLEHGPDLILDATWYLKRKSFTWNNESHSWTPGTTATVTSAMSCDLTPSLAHPSIAYDPYGNYIIAWEQMVCSGAYTEIRAKGFQGDQVVMTERSVTANAHDHEPDISYVYHGMDEDFWAIAYHGQVGNDTYSKAVALSAVNGGGTWWWSFQTPVNLTQHGQHAELAHLSGSQFFVAYNTSADGNGGNVRVDKCQISTNINVIESAIGETVDADSRLDIAVRGGDADFYVCYDKLNAQNGRDIFCARGHGTQLFVEPEENPAPVNLFPDNDQRRPVMAIAQSYPIHDNFYDTKAHPNDKYFEKRRMIVWETYGQDGANILGIAGQFRGIKASTNELSEWSRPDRFGVHLPAQLPPLVEQSVTITDPVVYMVSNVTVSVGATLTFGPGVTVKVAPGYLMDVKGSLIANNATFVQLEPNNPSPRWSGIYVTGNATLTGCTVDGATIGVEGHKATTLNLTDCTIQDCGTGLYAYQPAGTAAPQIVGCTFVDNDAEGISLLGTASATIDDCELAGNGGNGILLTTSFAKIFDCYIHGNGTALGMYGLNCYGSSPVLYCNDFENNFKGETALYNKSYPVLWAASGSGSGGVNSLLNATKSLISMWDSYPITKNGHNNFTVGGTGYFMADMSTAPKKRDISANYWNPTLSLSKLYPSSSSVYTWTATDAVPNSCGTGTGTGGSGAGALFAQGFDTEMSGNMSGAQSFYSQVISNYPDSSWALASAARLFETQRQINSGYTDLQIYLNEIAETNSDDVELVKTVQSLSTRAWVENQEYDPALNAYEQTMADPPSSTDSVYAATDYAITGLRAEYDGGSLDSYGPVVPISAVSSLLRTVDDMVSPVPQASHEGYLAIPTTVQLLPNFPNPFNAETKIRFFLPDAHAVRLEVYNIMGQKVATLFDGDETAGFHVVSWNAANVASGLYLCKLEVGENVAVQKMMLLR